MEVLKIGVPTLTFQLLTSLSIALINRAANGYGDAAIAGMGAVTRVTAMGTLVVFGFLKGFQPIAGFSLWGKEVPASEGSDSNIYFVVNSFLSNSGFANGSVFCADNFSICKYKYRNDCGRAAIQ